MTGGTSARPTPTALQCPEIVVERLAISLPLAIYALSLDDPCRLSGRHPGGDAARVADRTFRSMATTQLGVAIPNFWFALLMVLVFAVNLRWFSAGGLSGLGTQGSWLPSRR